MELKELNAATVGKTARPVRILQFGEGNFLRGFFDWIIERSNSKGVTDTAVAIVSPRFKENETIKALQRQEGLYHVCLEGIERGEARREISPVTCVADAFSPVADPERYRELILSPDLRFIVSNTTEAGIHYEKESDLSLFSSTFPAKITALLYERFRHFDGAPDKGIVFLCCELTEDNGRRLREYVLRHAADADLGEGFVRWVKESCFFCDTLVDRIVSGFPADTIEEISRHTGYADSLVVKGELFHVWAIGGDGAEVAARELPLDKAGLNVHFLPSVKEFRDKKVRILNGSHTGMVAVALGMGKETVLEAFSDPKISTFIRRMVDREVLPMIAGDPAELRRFADSILERFHNPYVRHMLKSIALNSLSKWEARNFPTVKDLWRRGRRLAYHELFTFAALLWLYSPGSGFTPEDNTDHIRLMHSLWHEDDLEASVRAITASGIFNENFEAVVPGFSKMVARYVGWIKDKGMEGALDTFMETDSFCQDRGTVI